MTPLDRALELIALRQKATAGEWWVSSRDDGHMLNNHNILNRDAQGDACVLLQANHYIPNFDNNLAFTAAAANHVVDVCEALEAAERRNAELQADNARLRAALEEIIVAYEKRGAYGPDDKSRAARAALEESR